MPISRTETGFGPGATGASAPRVPGIPEYSAHGSGTITIAFSSMGNDAVVVYSIRVKHDTGGGYAVKGYVQADGTVDAGEIFQTLAAWGATVEVSGLTDYVPYTFAAKSKNELAVESAWTSESAVMNTLPDVDYGLTSENLDRRVSGGDTIVDADIGLSVEDSTEVDAGDRTQEVFPEYYGDIILKYTLINDSSTASRVVIEWSENNVDWAACTEGTDPSSEGLTGLSTSPEGDEHIFAWDSYTDAGMSEQDTSVYLRVTPYDASPTGGDAALTVTSDAFAVNNRPARIAWENADGLTFSKDTTPTFRAIIPALRGGDHGFPELGIEKTDGGELVALYESVVSIVGWEYEDAEDSWNPFTPSGIPEAVIDGTNRMRFTPPVALSADYEYTIYGRMGEARDEG